jgi:hypothetical protein
MEYGYSLIQHIKIFNSDPICALDLNDELLLFGSMLGYFGYFAIKTKKLYVLSEIEDEHIIATQIKKNKLLFAVGDQKIVTVEKTDNNYNNPVIKENSNYKDEVEHYKKCDNMFCMLGGDYLFSIELNIPREEEKKVEERLCTWKIKNLEKKASFSDKINISNYWVPFDFDGYNLIYIDFFNDMKRCLNIFSFYHKKFLLKLNLWEKEDEVLGHISHLKKLSGEKIFLVHGYKICQIRDFKFKLLKEFIHKGNEIISCDISYNNKKELEIIILDLNCSVYLYNEKDDYEHYLFNLEKIDSINSSIKEQKFFSLGYPYFIKMYNRYFAITTDQGCFLLKRA